LALSDELDWRVLESRIGKIIFFNSYKNKT